MHRRGFTLVEILTVLAVIALLAGMLFPLLSTIRHRAMATKTVNRMESALAALQTVGSGRDRTLILQTKAGLPGVRRFDTTTDGASAKQGSFIDAKEPELFAFPWDKPDLINTPGDETNVENPAAKPKHSNVTLRQLNPQKTVALLSLGEVLPGSGADAAYEGDRSPSRDWNDAWGHPLVLAYGLFQPITPGGIQDALMAYQSNRIIYLAAGAAGPHLVTPLGGDWTANRAAIWKQANDGCPNPHRPDGNWTRLEFSDPPWQGVKQGRTTINGQQMRAFLSAPIEIR